ncbi:hypothetical protein [Streptomyces sp. NPDC051183]|uniref:hypothetical protein n=1 Tax=unclassified Streptomyces TaxID=2593676 RepID=UPI0034355967
MKKLSRNALMVGAVVAAVGAVGVAGSLTASANPASAAQAANATDMPYAVENFEYPKTEADAAFAARGIKLKSGDGNIMYVDCAVGGNLLEFYSSTDRTDTFCFSVTGNGGYLNLELPAVYSAKGNDYKVRVDMTVDNTEVSFDVKQNSWTSVGKLLDPAKRDHALVSIRATK